MANKYDALMRDIIEYLRDTWMFRTGVSLIENGLVRGSSDEEIAAAEQVVGKRMPAALRAWYSVAGKRPPDLHDHDADFSLDDFLRTQKVIADEELHSDSGWSLSRTLLPFSSRLGDQGLLLDTVNGEAEDPPVIHMFFGDTATRHVSIAFSAFMRECWLETLDGDWRQQSRRDIWRARRRIINDLAEEIRSVRKHLIEQVHAQDVQRGALTGPRAFQERWVAEFDKGELREKLRTHGLRYPFYWVRPPTAR